MKFSNFLLIAGLAVILAGAIMFLYGMYMVSNPPATTATAAATLEATVTQFCFKYFLPTFFTGIFITLIGGILKSTQKLNK